MQETALNDALDTLVVVPLDDDDPVYTTENPLMVRVSAREAGAHVQHVALPHHVTSMRRELFDAKAVGRLSVSSMARIDAILRRVLVLP